MFYPTRKHVVASSEILAKFPSDHISFLKYRRQLGYRWNSNTDGISKTVNNLSRYEMCSFCKHKNQNVGAAKESKQ